MALFRRPLAAPPDVPELLRRLGDGRGRVALWSADGEGPSCVGDEPVEVSHALDPEPALSFGALGEGASVPRWIGVLPYEALRVERPGRVAAGPERPPPHLSEPVWHRYAALAVVERGVVSVVGDDAAAVEALAARLEQAGPRGEPAKALRVELDAPEPREHHVARIRAALELIGRGELYQVNLARRFTMSVRGSSVDLLERLVEATRAPYAALLALDDAGVEVLATSPELLLATEPRTARGVLAVTSPIKGTRPRAAEGDRDGDAAEARALDADPKERAELAMILDVERNDLGRVAVAGSVRLREPPHVVSHPTVHHRVATVEGLLREGVGRGELLRAFLPSGSVTGAPKVRAMEVIAELEPHRRGLYTGGLGVVRHDGGLTLAMAIRTLTRRGSEAHYFAGGGIVADSDPEREVEETLWKAAQLERVAGPESLRRGSLGVAGRANG